MSDNTIKKCMEFCRYAKSDAPSPGKVKAMWRQAFNCAARDMGFTRKQRSFLWEQLAYGNWERLQLTDEEEVISAEEWLEQLELEVFYCSDRWSLDRLARCHWRYRQYVRKMEGWGEE